MVVYYYYYVCTADTPARAHLIAHIFAIKEHANLTKIQDKIIISKLDNLVRPTDLQLQPHIVDNASAEDHTTYQSRPFIDLQCHRGVRQLYNNDEYRLALSAQLKCYQPDHTVLDTIQALHGLATASTTTLFNIKRQYYKSFICYPKYFKSNIVRIIQGESPYRATVLGKRRLRVGTNAPT